MPSQRQLQVGEQIKRMVAEIFMEDSSFSFPNAYITILRADASPDIKNVRIFINIFGNENKKKIIEKLNSLTPYLRGQLSKKIDIRHTPQIAFALDDSAENADKISKLLTEEGKKFKD